MFGRRVIGLSSVQGAAVLLVVLTVYIVALRIGQAEAEARALTFATFLIGNLALIFTNRSWSRVILSSSDNVFRASGVAPRRSGAAAGGCGSRPRAAAT